VLKYEYVRTIVEAWANAWNRLDLEAIMAHYSEDVEMQGPTIVNRWGRSDGNLHGKDEVRTHFSLGLKLAPDLTLNWKMSSSAQMDTPSSTGARTATAS
jgi:SnoaL-like domain